MSAIAIMKCDFNGDLRRVSLAETSFSELKRVLGQLYDLTSDFTVKYLDDENDLITMTSDSELVEAINLSKATEQPLRLTLIATKPETKADSKPSEASKGDSKWSRFSRFSEEDKTAWREAWLARKAARKVRDASAAPSDDEGKRKKDETEEGDRPRRHWRKFARMMMMGRHGHHHAHAMPHFPFGSHGMMRRRRHCHSGSEKGMRRGHGLRRLARLAMLAGGKEKAHCGSFKRDSLKGRRCGSRKEGSFKGSRKGHCHRRRFSFDAADGAEEMKPRHFRRMMLLASLKRERMHGSRKEGRGCGMRRHGCGSRRAERMFA